LVGGPSRQNRREHQALGGDVVPQLPILGRVVLGDPGADHCRGAFADMAARSWRDSALVRGSCPCLSCGSLCALSCHGLVVSTRWGPCQSCFVVPARVLIGQEGFTGSMSPGYYPLHTPRTPAPGEFGDSRRAPAVRGYVRACQDRRGGWSRAARWCPLDVTTLALSVPSGVAGTPGMVRANCGGLRPGRTQGPAARTRSGDSGEEYNGRSRRWRCPWRGGIGGATAYFPTRRAGARRDHQASRAQPAARRRRALRLAFRADRHAAQPGARDPPLASRGQGVHPGHRGRPGRHTSRDTPSPAPGPERATTGGNRP